jgi:hypothetical protein
MPWNVREETELLLVDSGVHPAIATFAVSALYDEFGQSSADQRSTTGATAITHTPGDVDTVVAEVQSTVDVRGLDAALAAGVCSPTDYLHPSELSLAQFTLGIPIRSSVRWARRLGW